MQQPVVLGGPARRGGDGGPQRAAAQRRGVRRTVSPASSVPGSPPTVSAPTVTDSVSCGDSDTSTVTGRPPETATRREGERSVCVPARRWYTPGGTPRRTKRPSASETARASGWPSASSSRTSAAATGPPAGPVRRPPTTLAWSWACPAEGHSHTRTATAAALRIPFIVPSAASPSAQRRGARRRPARATVRAPASASRAVTRGPLSRCQAASWTTTWVAPAARRARHGLRGVAQGIADRERRAAVCASGVQLLYPFTRRRQWWVESNIARVSWKISPNGSTARTASSGSAADGVDDGRRRAAVPLGQRRDAFHVPLAAERQGHRRGLDDEKRHRRPTPAAGRARSARRCASPQAAARAAKQAAIMREARRRSARRRSQERSRRASRYGAGSGTGQPRTVTSGPSDSHAASVARAMGTHSRAGRARREQRAELGQPARRRPRPGRAAATGRVRPIARSSKGPTPRDTGEGQHGAERRRRRRARRQRTGRSLCTRGGSSRGCAECPARAARAARTARHERRPARAAG